LINDKRKADPESSAVHAAEKAAGIQSRREQEQHQTKSPLKNLSQQEEGQHKTNKTLEEQQYRNMKSRSQAVVLLQASTLFSAITLSLLPAMTQAKTIIGYVV
jgi:hypothetical protein